MKKDFKDLYYNLSNKLVEVNEAFQELKMFEKSRDDLKRKMLVMLYDDVVNEGDFRGLLWESMVLDNYGMDVCFENMSEKGLVLAIKKYVKEIYCISLDDVEMKEDDEELFSMMWDLDRLNDILTIDVEEGACFSIYLDKIDEENIEDLEHYVNSKLYTISDKNEFVALVKKLARNR